ncbi:hypothetical protein ACE3MZ_02465 [Paenibacillus sp. WLX1005]|uniref:hypothetical protein n=1 Tax=Paenibacillus sp. WLX1005 TaxID=3243766 RepID=UPI00398423E4
MKKKLLLTLALTCLFGAATPFYAASTYAASNNSTTAPSTDNASEDVSEDTEDLLSEVAPALRAEAQGLLDYGDALTAIATYEEKAVDTYNDYRYITSANRKQAYAAMTYTVIPSYTKFVAGLKQIKPANAELAKIHNKYIKAATLQLEALNLFKKYVASSKLNVSVLSQANQKITAGMNELNAYKAAVEKYSAKFEQ